ncbi:YbaN family protein [Paremcibacter congregatus]|uniref:DUF454 domain-containing protein n=1 Tax=Paremcibacter congregatus TaxID=2043170 RepID=A0A2G4YV36_9PROT|nr:YbaN family protein [Paremcibacter congregatus]PHZ86167.1 hypothetical protein CRD36_05725 [Paremcibacter congregatus]QDE27130.1 DUF454 domain-containing protein [Paremcibacter congregatus]
MIKNAKRAYGASKKAFWLTLGGIALALGLIGIPLPLLPTTPFLLLAVFCFSRSSEKLHVWLLDHPQFGRPIRQWQDHRAISRKNKVLAVLSMVVVFLVSYGFFDIPTYALMSQAIILTLVALFLTTRPEPPEAGVSEDGIIQEPEEGRS